MNVIKSLHASLVQRQFQFNHKYFTCISSYWGFKLSTGKPVLEQQYWTDMAKYIDDTGPLDEGMVKQQPEFLVYANAISPEQKEVQALLVEVEFAGQSKQLQVTGNREWQSRGISKIPTEPEPFTQMPLDYKHAFGGELFLPNPVGKGFKTDALPNVEYPNQVMGSANAKAEPASFANLNCDWSARKALAGTYDQSYIDDHMPGLAIDVDWHYFNVAPKDQWLDLPLLGTEAFTLTNLNVDLPVLTGQLPNIRARAFVEQKVEAEAEFKEVNLTLDTVLLFPNDDLGILIHRGTCEVSHQFGKDITKLMLAHEFGNDEMLPLAHYQQEMTNRSDPDNSWKYLLDTSALIPAGISCGLQSLVKEGIEENQQYQGDNLQNFAEQSASQLDGKMQEQLDKVYQELEQRGCEEQLAQLKQVAQQNESVSPEQIEDENLKQLLALQSKILPDPDEFAKELDFTKLDLDALEELSQYSEQMAQQYSDSNIKHLEKQIAELKQNPHLNQNPEVIEKLELMLARLTQLPLLPRMSEEEMKASADAQQKMLDKQASSINDPEVLKHLTDEQKQTLALAETATQDFSLEKQQQEALDFIEESYLQTAHFMDEARSPHAGEEQSRADKLIHSYQNNLSTENTDIAFAQLANTSLAGAKLTKSLMEYSQIQSCNFAKADLTKANFAKSKLHDCNFSEAEMAGVNLGAAQLSSCIFKGQTFTEATFAKSVFENCKFERCNFGERLDAWLETELSGVSLC